MPSVYTASRQPSCEWSLKRFRAWTEPLLCLL